MEKENIEPNLEKPELQKTHKPYTSEDQEFFFRIASEIAEHFNELEDVPKDNIVDAIIFLMDLMVPDIENNLSIFNSWKSAQISLKAEGAGLVWNSGTFFGTSDAFPRPILTASPEKSDC